MHGTLLVNLAVVFLLAIALAKLFERFRLPSLVGMLLAGVALGQFAKSTVLDMAGISASVKEFLGDYIFISGDLLAVSGELRTAALLVILLRAGLGIDRGTLNRVGIPAAKLACIPCLLEAGVVASLAVCWLGFSWLEGGLLAFVLAAVSPAVVVPAMLDIRESASPRAKDVSTLILAGASVDDVVAITLFSCCLGFAGATEGASLAGAAASIPISILTGIVLGGLCGFAYERIVRSSQSHPARLTLKFILVAIFLHHLGELKWFPLASLLGVMTMGFVVFEKNEALAHKLATTLKGVWVFAELVLFVMIGAVVDLSVLGGIGPVALGVIALGLVGRSAGVWMSLAGSRFTPREKLFAVIAYWPKATVQAAIGGVVLLQVTAGTISIPHGRAVGEEILAIAVLSIVITAPLGAILIKTMSPRLLGTEQKDT
ncbi:MAG: sodium:proton antiporter [Phycisphaerales bacterium]|jgi:solute carrier family 9B (sodium/hydrogen exchanger), member 1/2|nr:sodium:proton antiporter [Phycisphaerales bacterium]MBT7171775.1 sodium:proton antiporter [Phycisphaerales bacterium]